MDAGCILRRDYSYDLGGNVKTITDVRTGGVQNFTYDERDRLTRGWTTGTALNPYDESSAYDAIGNLTSKAGVSYAYGANGNGTGSVRIRHARSVAKPTAMTPPATS